MPTQADKTNPPVRQSSQLPQHSPPQQRNAVTAPPPSSGGSTENTSASTPAAAASSSRQYSPDRPSEQIFKVFTRSQDGGKKVIDFTSRLTKAKIKDFANIHGCGGSGYSPNSTIRVTICDASAKPSSITVKYSVDVEDFSLLREAAIAAGLGNLRPPAIMQPGQLNAMEQLVAGWQQLPLVPNGGYRPIPERDVQFLTESIRTAKAEQQRYFHSPWWTYEREKNDPYKKGSDGYGPVSKIQIAFTPYINGQPSAYPWFIRIENFDAPIVKKESGANVHHSKKARDYRSAFINLSASDFAAALTACERFIRLWETTQMGPVMEEAYRRIGNGSQGTSQEDQNGE